MIRFPLSDFIIYIAADHKTNYQRKKALKIFKDLEAFQIFKLQTFTLMVEIMAYLSVISGKH